MCTCPTVLGQFSFGEGGCFLHLCGLVVNSLCGCVVVELGVRDVLEYRPFRIASRTLFVSRASCRLTAFSCVNLGGLLFVAAVCVFALLLG